MILSTGTNKSGTPIMPTHGARNAAWVTRSTVDIQEKKDPSVAFLSWDITTSVRKEKVRQKL
jgi:hypothetical protein